MLSVPLGFYQYIPGSGGLKKKKLRNKCQGINIACILLTALDSSDNGGRTEQYILVEVTAFHSSSFLEQLTHSRFQKSK